MKLATYWWGCQFLAETEDDVEVLEDILHRVGGNVQRVYATGDIVLMWPSFDMYPTEFEFTVEQLGAAKAILEINR